MQTEVYRLLMEEEKQNLAHRLSILVDQALISTDIKMVQIGQSIRRECLFLRRLEELAEGEPIPAERPANNSPSKLFEDFEVPDFIRVGEGTYR